MRKHVLALILACLGLFCAGVAAAGAPAIPPSSATLNSIPSMGSVIRQQGWSVIGVQGGNPSMSSTRTPSFMITAAKSGTTSLSEEISPISVPSVKIMVGNVTGVSAYRWLPNSNPILWHVALWRPYFGIQSFTYNTSTGALVIITNEAASLASTNTVTIANTAYSALNGAPCTATSTATFANSISCTTTTGLAGVPATGGSGGYISSPQAATYAIPVTFNGQEYFKQEAANVAFSDPIPFQVDANVPYVIRLFCGTPGRDMGCPAPFTTGGGAGGASPASLEGNMAEDVVKAGTFTAGTGSVESGIPIAVLGYTGTNPTKTIACIGDSRTAGVGDSGAVHGGNASGGACLRFCQNATVPNLQWPNASVSYGCILLGRGGDTIQNFAAPNGGDATMQVASAATTVIDELGINDIGTSLAAMKAAKLIVAVRALRYVKAYNAVTLEPETTSTDNWRTTTNQTVLGNSTTVRIPFNDWLRDTSGAGFMAQAAAACLNDLACAANTKNNPAAHIGFIESANSVECNSGGTQVQDGGLWCGGNTCPYSGSVTTGGNNSSFTDSALTPGTLNAYRAYEVAVTSGSNNGLNAGVFTVNTGHFVSLLGEAASMVNFTIGDTYLMCTNITTHEGIHGTAYTYALEAAAWQTQTTAVIQ